MEKQKTNASIKKETDTLTQCHFRIVNPKVLIECIEVVLDISITPLIADDADEVFLENFELLKKITWDTGSE